MTHSFDALCLTSSPSATPSAKQQALRALNDETSGVRTALNQAQSAIAHALRVIETDYQRKRTAIINTPGE